MPSDKETKKIIDEAAKEIKEFNKIAKSKIFTLDDDESYDQIERFTTGIRELDEVLNGGWGKGNIVELYGPEASGKTTIAYRTEAAVQRLGINCLHYDCEQTFNKDLAELNGVILNNHPNRLRISHENEAEKIMQEIEVACENKEFGVIVIDSLAAMVPREMLKKEIGEMTVGALSKMMSICLPRISSLLKKSGTVLIFINQLREVIGANKWEDAEKTPGGRALKFFASVRLEIQALRPSKNVEYKGKAGYRPDMYDEESEIQIGHVLKGTIKKSKISKPFGVFYTDIWYEHIPEIDKIIKLARDEEILSHPKRVDGKIKSKKTLLYKDKEFYSEETRIENLSVLEWLRENNLYVDLLVDHGSPNLEALFKEGNLTKEETLAFYKKTSELSSGETKEEKKDDLKIVIEEPESVVVNDEATVNLKVEEENQEENSEEEDGDSEVVEEKKRRGRKKKE